MKYLRHIVHGEENAAFIFVSELNPHSNGEGRLSSSEEWNNECCTAACGVRKTKVIIDLDG